MTFYYMHTSINTGRGSEFTIKHSFTTVWFPGSPIIFQFHSIKGWQWVFQYIFCPSYPIGPYCIFYITNLPPPPPPPPPNPTQKENREGKVEQKTYQQRKQRKKKYDKKVYIYIYIQDKILKLKKNYYFFFMSCTVKINSINFSSILINMIYLVSIEQCKQVISNDKIFATIIFHWKRGSCKLQTTFLVAYHEEDLPTLHT